MFDTLENYILITFPYLRYATTISSPQVIFPEERLASLKYLYCGTTGLFFQLLATDKFYPILLLIKSRYGR